MIFASTNQPPPRRATLRDVADRAGVSRSTVSAVLNNACLGTRMSASTRERVFQAATDLSYRPNAVARSLRHQSMNTIGFYNGFGLVDLHNPFLAAILDGTHNRCDHYDCDLLFHRQVRNNDVRKQLREITSGKVDGVLLYIEVHDPLIELLIEQKFPAVTLADVHPGLPSVTADDEAGSGMIARRLAAAGHKRVLYRIPPCTRDSANCRRDAFVAAAEPLGMRVETRLTGDFLGMFGRDELALLNGPVDSRPTAICCWNDGSALEALKYYQALPGSPNRPAIFGFDGFKHEWLSVTLSTVYVPWSDVAMAAVDTLQQVIAGQPVQMRTKVPVRLIEGDTG